MQDMETLFLKPGENKKIKIRAKIKTNNVKINNENNNVPNIAFKNSYVLLISLSCSYSAYIGTKAWLKAPSAKNLLNKLGIFKKIWHGLLF